MRGEISKLPGGKFVENPHQRFVGRPAPGSDSNSPLPTPPAHTAPPNVPRQKHSAVEQLSRQDYFANTPADVLEKIANYLPVADKSAMSRSNKATHDALRDHLFTSQVVHFAISRVVQKASRVDTLGKLQDSLLQICSLNPDARAKPLQQLMKRLGAVPLNDRATALRSWRAAANELPAEDRPVEPPRLEHILSFRNANEAALSSENLAHVISCFAITGDLEIVQLERRAANSAFPNSAGWAVAIGENVQLVAQEHGFRTPEGIASLEVRAAQSRAPNSAGWAVANGENLQPVAQRHGLTTHEGIAALEVRAAQSSAPTSAGWAVANGENLQLVIQRHGFTTPEGIAALEVKAAQSRARNSAGAAAAKGGNVQRIAQRYGITSPEGIEALEMRSVQVHSYVGDLVRDNIFGFYGQNVQRVAQRYGITTPRAIEALELRAIDSNPYWALCSAVANGKNVQLVAKRRGITTIRSIEILELVAAESRAPNSAGRAVADGENPQDVALRHGFTTRKGFAALSEPHLQSELFRVFGVFDLRPAFFTPSSLPWHEPDIRRR